MRWLLAPAGALAAGLSLITLSYASRGAYSFVAGFAYSFSYGVVVWTPLSTLGTQGLPARTVRRFALAYCVLVPLLCASLEAMAYAADRASIHHSFKALTATAQVHTSSPSRALAGRRIVRRIGAHASHLRVSPRWSLLGVHPMRQPPSPVGVRPSRALVASPGLSL